jgi:hypothetical protein
MSCPYSARGTRWSAAGRRSSDGTADRIAGRRASIRFRSRATQRRMKSLPRSPLHQSLPLMCPRGSQTLLSLIRQSNAGAVERMTLTSWNRTRSSPLSAAMARISFGSPRRAHVGRERGPCQLALRGSERAQQPPYRTGDSGATRTRAAPLQVRPLRRVW